MTNTTPKKDPCKACNGSGQRGTIAVWKCGFIVVKCKACSGTGVAK